MPAAPVVNVYHTVFEGAVAQHPVAVAPAFSPASSVAPTFVPLVQGAPTVRGVAFAQLLFGCASANDAASMNNAVMKNLSERKFLHLVFMIKQGVFVFMIVGVIN
jgi:hypothetical protein